MIEITNQLQGGAKEKTPLVERIPRPHFHGMLVTPEGIGALPNGKKAIATFNAAVVSIPHPNSGEAEHIAVYRVNTSGHTEGRPDGTEFFGIQKFTPTDDGLKIKAPTFVTAASLLQPADRDNNGEDMRLVWDDAGKRIVGGETQADTKSMPYIALIQGTPVYGTDGVSDIAFSEAVLAKELVDGKVKPIEGKNVQVELGENGQMHLRYRPESIDGEVNRTHFRTLSQSKDGYWQQVGEDGIYGVDPKDILPTGDTLYKFGLNGKAIPLPNGDVLRIDHICSITPEGKYRYGFITKIGNTIKPLLSYEQAIALSGAKGEDLTGEKLVIYSNGNAIVPYKKEDGSDGQQLIMAVTLFDKSIGIFSYDLDELATYAKKPLH